MSYRDELIAASKARAKRLQQRSPKAGPMPTPPLVKIIPLKNGLQPARLPREARDADQSS